MKLRELPSLVERGERKHWAVMGNKVRGQAVKRLKYRRLRNGDLILQNYKMQLEIVSRGAEDETRAIRKISFIAGKRWTGANVWHNFRTNYYFKSQALQYLNKSSSNSFVIKYYQTVSYMALN